MKPGQALARSKVAAAVLALLAVATTAAQDFDLEWWSIDGGGEILSNDGQNPPGWELSGTVGQWDGVAPGADPAGGAWEVTGGLWGMDRQTDTIFRDRFGR